MKRFGTINVTVFSWSILFLLLLRPSGLVSVLNISGITRLLNMVSVLIVIFLSIARHAKPSKSNVYYIVYFIYMLGITIIVGGNPDDIYDCAKMVISNIGLTVFVFYSIQKDTEKSLKSMLVVYGILISINFILMFVYPHGMYNMDQYITYGRSYWLFGHQNSTITYALPAIAVAMILYTRQCRRAWKIWSIYTIIISVLSIFISQSATSIIGIIVFFAVYFLMKQDVLVTVLTTKTAMIGGIAVFIAVVFFQIQYIFSSLFEILFSREATLTGRIIIWEQTLLAIKNNWIFGIGYKVNTVLQQTIRGSSAHNEWLYSLLQGGVVLLFLFAMVFISESTKIDTHRDQDIGKIYISLYFSLFIQFLVETHMHRLAPLIALIGCAPIILATQENKQRKLFKIHN